MWFKYFLLVWYAFQICGVALLVGKEREPMTAGAAAFCSLIYLLIFLEVLFTF